MKKRWFNTLALLLVLVMTLSACGSNISNEVDSESSSAIETGNDAGQAEDYTEQEIPDNTADEEPPAEAEPLTVQSAKCTSLAGSSWYTIGLRADGTLLGTGMNEDGQRDVDDWTDVVAVATSFHHAVGLR